MSTTRQAEVHRADVVEPTGRRVGEHGRMGEIVRVSSARRIRRRLLDRKEPDR